MSATTFEQLITAHGDMIARHDMRDTTDFTTTDFIETIDRLGRLYATGMGSDLQAAADDLTAAANYLTDAELHPVNAGVLIAQADQRLQSVDDLALA